MELNRRDHKERHAQQILAREVTTLVHGEKAAHAAKAASEILFGDKDLSSLDSDALLMLRTEAPSCAVQEGENILDVLVKSEIAESKTTARRLVLDKAVRLNGTLVTSEKRDIEKDDFINGVAILGRGKRNVCVLVLA